MASKIKETTKLGIKFWLIVGLGISGIYVLWGRDIAVACGLVLLFLEGLGTLVAYSKARKKEETSND